VDCKDSVLDWYIGWSWVSVRLLTWVWRYPTSWVGSYLLMIIVWSRLGWHFATLTDWYSYASFSEHCVDPDMNMKCFRCELPAPLLFKYDYDSSMTFFLLETFAYRFCACVLRHITFSHSLNCFIFCNLCKKVAFVLWHHTLNQYTHHIHSWYFFGIKILSLWYSYHCVQFSNYVCIDMT
jgi:hypothetical protein